MITLNGLQIFLEVMTEKQYWVLPTVSKGGLFHVSQIIRLFIQHSMIFFFLTLIHLQSVFHKNTHFLQAICFRASCFSNWIFTVDYSCLLSSAFNNVLHSLAHSFCLRQFWILVLFFSISAAYPTYTSCLNLQSILSILPSMLLSIFWNYTRSKTDICRIAFSTFLSSDICSLIAALRM